MSLRPTCAACAALLLMLALGGCTDDEAGTDAAANGADATTTASATPESTATPAPVERFSVGVREVATHHTDSAGLFGRPETGPDPARVSAAVDAAVATLQAYLDAQFLDPDTRFSGDPLRVLLRGEAQQVLTDDGRRALGVLDVAVASTKAGPASTAASVVVAPDQSVRSVTLRYRAQVVLVAPDGTATPLTQEGDLVMTERDGTWAAAAADVRLIEDEA